MWCSFHNKPFVLLTLLNILLQCSWKSGLVTKSIPKCFWVSDWVTTLLPKINEGWDDFWILQEKRTSWVSLLGSGLKLIFHRKTQLFILFKSSFKFFPDKSLSNITEKRDVSSVNSLGLLYILGKSFIYIKKCSGQRIEPWGTLSSTLTHVEFWSFRTTLCWNSCTCQTLLKALDMSRKTPLTSKPLRKDWYTSWVIDNNWLIHASLDIKPDWLEEINSF